MDAKAFLGRGIAYPLTPALAGELALAEYEEDIRQAVLIILETGRGERLMRPDFGAGLHQFVFEPINTATMALLRHRVEEALVTWEPRIVIVGVLVQGAGASAPTRVDIQVEYRVRRTNTFYNLVYPFYLQEGAA